MEPEPSDKAGLGVVDHTLPDACDDDGRNDDREEINDLKERSARGGR